MNKTLVAAICLVISCTASAFQPRTGHWWNPAESGRGFNIDIQNGVMVLTVYAYDAAGNAQWYLAAGNMTNGQHNFTATLDKYAGGQCVTCAYRPGAVMGNDGVVAVNFTNETSATVTLPGGRVSAIRPLNFAYGDVPQGMLGEWVFVEDILSTSFADRFHFTQVAGNPAFALDLVKRAGCETGDTPNEVICVDTSASGALAVC